jgi:hypothetical protein
MPLRADVLRAIAAESRKQLKESAMQLSEIKKTVINVLGLVVAVGGYAVNDATGLVPDGVAKWIAFLIGVATVVVSYLAPNETTDPARVAGKSVRLKNEKPV